MTEHSQFALLGKKRFLPFFLTQLLGAFNDNIFKQSLILAISDPKRAYWETTNYRFYYRYPRLFRAKSSRQNGSQADRNADFFG